MTMIPMEKEAYRRMYDWLVSNRGDCAIAMADFILRNTLSEHSGVTGGCRVSEDRAHVLSVAETRNIVRTVDCAGPLGLRQTAPNW